MRSWSILWLVLSIIYLKDSSNQSYLLSGAMSGARSWVITSIYSAAIFVNLCMYRIWTTITWKFFYCAKLEWRFVEQHFDHLHHILFMKPVSTSYLFLNRKRTSSTRDPVWHLYLHFCWMESFSRILQIIQWKRSLYRRFCRPRPHSRGLSIMWVGTVEISIRTHVG